MDVRVLLRETRLPVPAVEALAWHLRPGALQRLIPAWSGVRVTAERGSIAQGGEVELSVPVGPFRRRWVARHEDFVSGSGFVDRQVCGPFRHWRHVHRVVPVLGGCQWEDQIEYALPRGAGCLASLIEANLERTLAFRHRRLRDDVVRHATASRSLRIAVSGSSGLIGTQLVPFLTSGGHQVLRLVRGPADPGSIAWTPGRSIDAVSLAGCDAVIHLAGLSVAQRWSPATKIAIRDSRVLATRQLCEALAAQVRRPEVLICASACGFYGDTGERAVKEGSPGGDGFLAEVCREWEEACEPARQAGIRVVNVRFGLVLGVGGGALASLHRLARLGLAGPIAGGAQWLSWIAVDDCVGILHQALFADDLVGPVNAVAPEPVTNRELIKSLGRTLGRPAILPVPGFAVGALFGEMGHALLMADQRVLPARLLGRGFPFRHPDLLEALRFELGR